MKRAAKALIYDAQGRLLVLYRSETHPHLAHDIDLPGGEIELEETVEIGLMREVLEETGLEVTLSEKELRHSWDSPWGQQQYLYEITCPQDVEAVMSWEHESHQWVDPEVFIRHKAICSFMHEAQQWLRERQKLTK